DRFPRIRGDRPAASFRGAVAALFPPHTRGSTGGSRTWLAAYTVSPAYAGIDPIRTGFLPCGCGFPRIRGDRPFDVRTMSRALAFPPHTRGSTCGHKVEGYPDTVSPAYAGIDRSLIWMK